MSEQMEDKENKDTYATLFFQTYNQSNGLNFVFLKFAQQVIDFLCFRHKVRWTY